MNTTQKAKPMKRIVFDRLTKDFSAYLDDNYIGSFATHLEAQVALDALVSAQQGAGN